MTDLELGYSQFAADGSVLVYCATVTFEEILDVRVLRATTGGPLMPLELALATASASGSGTTKVGST